MLLSEYPSGTRARQGLFPKRNRIIAGLTLGTLVVEADIRSGSFITADAALEAGRDVFAVPGPITSPKSRGATSLSVKAVKLVTCAADLLEEYRLGLPNADQLPYNRGQFDRTTEPSGRGYSLRLSSADEQLDLSVGTGRHISLMKCVELLSWGFWTFAFSSVIFNHKKADYNYQHYTRGITKLHYVVREIYITEVISYA